MGRRNEPEGLSRPIKNFIFTPQPCMGQEFEREEGHKSSYTARILIGQFGQFNGTPHFTRPSF